MYSFNFFYEINLSKQNNPAWMPYSVASHLELCCLSRLHMTFTVGETLNLKSNKQIYCLPMSHKKDARVI